MEECHGLGREPSLSKIYQFPRSDVPQYNQDGNAIS